MDRTIVRARLRSARGAAPRYAALACALAAGGIALTACAAPPYRYVSSDADDVVVRVPASWTTVSSGPPTPTDGSTPPPGSWTAVYDSARRPDAKHAHSRSAADPVAFAQTVPVTKEESVQVTDDVLRNLVLPVTADARSSDTLAGNATGLQDFQLIADQTVRTKTARGVHVTYSYDLGAGIEVFDQIAVMDVKKTRVHLLFVHCTASCWRAHQQDITGVVRSFTVKAP